MVGKYVLYADDDFDDQELLTEAMAEKAADTKLVCVQDGYDVIHHLDNLKSGNHYPCAIVLDINMPGLGGLQTLKLLREDYRFNKIPIVIFSTSSHRSDIDTAITLGATEFMTKPVRPGQLETIATKLAAYCHTHPQNIC